MVYSRVCHPSNSLTPLPPPSTSKGQLCLYLFLSWPICRDRLQEMSVLLYIRGKMVQQESLLQSERWSLSTEGHFNEGNTEEEHNGYVVFTVHGSVGNREVVRVEGCYSARAHPSLQQASIENLSPAMNWGVDSRNRVWNWVAKLQRLAGRYDNPMPMWFLAPISGT